jgi:hypothetical protein
MQFKYKRKQRTVQRRLKWTVQKASMEILLTRCTFSIQYVYKDIEDQH